MGSGQVIDKEGQSHNSSLSPTPGQQLESWKEIAAYLKKDVRTVQRWEKQESLPIHRHVHSKLGTVYAYKAEIDAWWRNGHERLEVLASKDRRKFPTAYSAFALAGAVLAGVLLIVLNPAGIRGWVPTRSRSTSRPPVRTVILESFPGSVWPAFSPDGKWIAFSWAPNGLHLFDLYLKRVGAEETLRLTHRPVDFPLWASWSPDGHYIAFVRQDQSATALYIVPPEGGEEKRLVNITWDPGGLDVNISWSPDSKYILYPDRTDSAGTYAIFRISATSLERQALTTPASGARDFDPSISPDGQSLSFVRRSSASVLDIFVASLSGKGMHRLNIRPNDFAGHAWTQDSRSIVFAGNVDGVRGIWRVGLNSEKPELLVANTKAAMFELPTLLNGGRQLAFLATFVRENVWQADLIRRGKPRLLISSTADEFPQFSPDGRRIAFQSKRSGYWEVWVSDDAGRNSIQLTQLHSFAVFPRWSPDGKKIIFDVRDAYSSHIYMIDSRGGEPQRLETGGSRDETPFWSVYGRCAKFAPVVATQCS
jgi:Tol biopolymer transport system component